MNPTHGRALSAGNPTVVLTLGTAFTLMVAIPPAANAQSLFQRPIVRPQPVNPGVDKGDAANAPAAPAPATGTGGAGGQPGQGGPNGQGKKAAPMPVPIIAVPMAEPMSLADTSLLRVVAPRPKVHQKHDKVEIIVNQSTLQKSEQKLDTKKESKLSAELAQFPSLRELILNATIADGIATDGGTTPKVSFNGDSEFKSSGTAERKDRITARLSALVVEVKPNGLLLIEARETTQQDDDVKTLVVSGLADPKDITNLNTIQSSQLANLIIRVEHDGTLKRNAEKGFITRFFDAVFNF